MSDPASAGADDSDLDHQDTPTPDHQDTNTSTLWYEHPARTWNEALPIGNGRLGAMVYGRTGTELLQLNEDSIYYGGSQDRTPKDAVKHLPELRRLIREGDHEKAEELVNLAFIPTPSCQRHYEPLATVKVEFGHDEDHISGYKRALDLYHGVASVEYEHDGVNWRREMIASHSRDVMVLRITSSRKARFVVRLSRLSDTEWDTNEFYDKLKVLEGRLVMSFATGGDPGVRSSVVLGAQYDAGGEVKVIGGSMIINASKTHLVFSAQTSFRCAEPTIAAVQDLDNVSTMGLEPLWRAHTTEHTKQMSAMQFSFNPSSHDSPEEPTDTKSQKPFDPKLFELYQNHARYLLLSSSRSTNAQPALSLPSNLQGIWNPSFSPPWGCRFTININTQMNYWPCHTWNLSACSDPLFYLLMRMAERGQQTARQIYGSTRAGAWCAHHNTDIWADTNPVDRWMPSALWPLGGAWLCLHIWERYEFEGDEDMIGEQPFLQKMLPVMEGAVLFLLDFLTEDTNTGHLVTNPSLSPENSYYQTTASGSQVTGTLCEGSTMDIQITAALFRAYISAVDSLPTASLQYIAEVQSTLYRLPPLTINPQDSRLQEWQHPYPEPEPGHRHFSHLFPLYPGNAITTPDLFAACRKVLDERLLHGGGHTGWSRAWLICLYARLRDGEECLKHLKLMLQTSTLPNLFSNHPPMQIDGNFGAAAGMLEMGLQSHEVELGQNGGKKRVIRLLPAWPDEWWQRGGRVRGIKARGGFNLSFGWEVDGVGEITVKSDGREEALVMLPRSGTVGLPLRAGTFVIRQSGGHLVVGGMGDP